MFGGSVNFLGAHTGYERKDSQQGMCHQVGYDDLNRQEWIEVVHGKRPCVTLDVTLNSPPFYKETQSYLEGELSSFQKSVRAIFLAPLQLKGLEGKGCTCSFFPRKNKV